MFVKLPSGMRIKIEDISAIVPHNLFGNFGIYIYLKYSKTTFEERFIDEKSRDFVLSELDKLLNSGNSMVEILAH